MYIYVTIPARTVRLIPVPSFPKRPDLGVPPWSYAKESPATTPEDRKVSPGKPTYLVANTHVLQWRLPRMTAEDLQARELSNTLLEYLLPKSAAAL